MSRPDVTGSYETAGFSFSIENRAGRLVIVEPAVPAGFEPALEWTGPSALKVTSGPLAGAEIEITVEDGRATGGLAGGVIPIERTSGPPSRAPGTGLVSPEYRADNEWDSTFRESWAERTRDGLLDAPGGFPLHLFVQWLMAQEEFIFHGSNRTDIEEFQPVRKSMEISNVGGHGNLGAVYGTHNGLWAMFFSIADRSQIRGSVRNGFGTYTSTEGETVDLYQFSIEAQSLANRPFSSGALYVLPRERFERIPIYPGGPASNEWACFEKIRPLAAISVEPEDFPFLDQIGGHDDGDLLRLLDVGDEVFSHVARAVRITDGVRLEFDDQLTPEVRDDWIELGLRFYPDVNRTLINETTVELSGPPAFVHSIEEQFSDLEDPTGSGSELNENAAKGAHNDAQR